MPGSGGIALIALLCASAGCATHVTAVRPLPTERETEINNIVAGKTATLEFAGTAQPIRSKDVRLAVSAVRFVERDPASAWGLSSGLPEREAPLSSLQSIKIRNAGRGALHGLAFGGAIGAIAGGTAGAVLAAVTCSCDFQFVPLAALEVGLVFGLIGAGIGALIGAPTTVEFSDAPAR
jgi:hypothetical protein